MDYIIIGAVVVLIIALLLIYYNSSRSYASVPMPPSVTPVTPTAPLVPNNTPVTPTAPPSPITASVQEMVGCYLDSSDRALPTTLPAPVTLEECAKAAKNAGSMYFGMQYPEGSQGTSKAQCWYGNGKYDKHGASTKCYLRDSQGRYLGGVWANSVYKI
jgi:hypothetical protein